MGTISVTLPVAGTDINAGLLATDLTTIANAINGGLDSTNVAAGGISRTNLATVTRKAPMVVGLRDVAGIGNSSFPDAASSGIIFHAIVPDDYVSGDITVKALLRSTVINNNMRMRRAVYRFRDGVAFNTIEAATDTSVAIPATLNAAVTYAFAIVAANFQAGDVLRIDLLRLGADGADTNTGAGDIDGAWIEYTGRS